MSEVPQAEDFAELREKVLRRLRRMLELNADIDRNASDAEFANGGNRIEYIFDENIFEMFVRPFDRSEYVNAFFASRPKTPAQAEPGLAMNAQSALISSEYLLGGNLPGQQDRPILLTEWHFWELHERVRTLTDKIRERAGDESNVTEIKWFINELDKLETSYANAAVPLEDLLKLTGAEIADDATQLKNEGWPDHVLSRFVIARESARLLSIDDAMSPADQLHRIFSDEIAPRLRPLHFEYPILKSAKEEVGKATRDWMRRLLREQNLRSRTFEPDQGRGRGSLQNDARALAYILWVAREYGSPELRFVFVTGDSLTFDAYRRWHSDEALSEPFVLRRPLQYAPMLNFKDSSSDAAKTRPLFEGTRRAVEISLLIFNLGIMQPETSSVTRKTPSNAAAQRETLLLMLAAGGHPTIEFFRGPPDPAWWRDRRKMFDSLRDDWRRFERVAIGANYGLIARRLDLAQRRKTEMIAAIGADASGSVIASYTEGLLDRITRSSIRVWFPLAMDFIHASRQQEGGLRPEPRAPLALRLRVPSPSGAAETVSLAHLLEQWAPGREAARELPNADWDQWLQSRVHVAFAIAAGMALWRSLWTAAERYAGLAVTAADAHAGEQIGEDGAECRYLRALAIRFRIGSFVPYRAKPTEDVWGRWLLRAENALSACASYYRNSEERTPDRTLGELRAVSERAALALFYASWLAAARDQKLPSVLTPERGFERLQDAEVDLRQCRKLALGVDPATLDREQRDFFAQVRRQYTVNIASADLVSALFNRHYGWEPPAFLLANDGDLVNEMRELIAAAHQPPLPPAVQFDLQAFLALRLRDVAAKDWLVANFAEVSRASTLPIDVEMIKAINRLLKETINDG